MKKMSKVLLSTLVAALMALCLCGVAGCGSKADTGKTAVDETEGTITIFAANSLEKALNADDGIIALYNETHPNITITPNTAASGTLVSQLQADPTAADILVTASKSSMDTAITNGGIDDASRLDLFSNDLEVVAKTDSSITVSDLNDLTTNADITTIAIGQPDTVPAGKYAYKAIDAVGIRDALAGKFVEFDKVGSVASAVSSGDAQVGFVYTSDLYRFDGIKSIYTIASDLTGAIVYPSALTSSASDVAKDFYTWMTTDENALAVFAAYGFEVIA